MTAPPMQPNALARIVEEIEALMQNAPSITVRTSPKERHEFQRKAGVILLLNLPTIKRALELAGAVERLSAWNAANYNRRHFTINDDCVRDGGIIVTLNDDNGDESREIMGIAGDSIAAAINAALDAAEGKKS